MKIYMFLSSVCLGFTVGYSQMNDCTDPIVNGCSSSDFIFSSVGDDVDDFPVGSAAAGCLFSGDNELIYLVLTANGSGLLEWNVQGDAGTGLLDWAIWPYNSSTCAGLLAGTLAPLACNWNLNSVGFAGMSDPNNLPAGASAGNFENPIMLSPGQTILLGISNYSNSLDGQNITLTFENENLISCQPFVADQIICQGSSAIVTISTPGFPSPTFEWLVTTGVSNTMSGTDVIVTPDVTTLYQVRVMQGATASQVAYDEVLEFTIEVAALNDPDAGMDQMVCLSDSIVLSGNATVLTNDFEWSSTTDVLPQPSIIYSPNDSSLLTSATVSAAGVYTFYLEEGNGVCPNAIDSCQITVLEIDQSYVVVNPSCAGFPDGEIHISSISGTIFSFDSGVSWQNSPIATGLASGIYTICTKNVAECQICTSVTVTDPPEVIIVANKDTVICENGMANLTVSASGGNSYVCYWSMTSDPNFSQVVTPIIETNYSVFVENENGCLSNVEVVEVSILPPLTATISMSDTICLGDAATLIATCVGGDGAYTYTWTTGFVAEGVGNSITVSPTDDRLYSVSISDGCESTIVQASTIIVVEEPLLPSCSVAVNEMCEPAVFSLHNTTNSDFIDQITWNISNGDIYVGQDITTNGMSEGLYGVAITVTTETGCSETTEIDNFLIVQAKPDIKFKYFPNPIKMFNTKVTFANTTNNAVAYLWSFEQGVPAESTEIRPTVAFPDGYAGRYKAQLIASSAFGCLDTLVQEVIVHKEVLLYAPNSFTPDGDSHNQTWRVFAEGIDEYDFELFVYNRWGEVVWESHDVKAEWDGRFGSEEALTGMYTWTVRTKDSVNDAKYFHVGHIQLLR